MDGSEKLIAAALIAVMWVAIEVFRKRVIRTSGNAHVQTYYRAIPYIYVPVFVLALLAIAVV